MINYRNNNNNNISRSRKRAPISDINITPFVDVLLVLLIIFMVAAPMMTGSVEVDLPKGANQNQNSEKTEPISIVIKADGSIYLQDQNIKLNLLSKKLLEIAGNNLDRKIFIRADQKLDYGRVMEVVRITNLTGFNQAVLVTELSL